jgi:hypothetical protein
MAIQRRYSPVVKLLLDYGANPHEYGNQVGSPLYYAHGSQEIAKTLVTYGAVPLDIGSYGQAEKELYGKTVNEHNKEFRKNLVPLLTPHFPVFQEESGASIVELINTYVTAPLDEEIRLNKEKVKNNIIRLNETLPPARRRHIPAHLTGNILQDAYEVKRNETGFIVPAPSEKASDPRSLALAELD